MRLLGFQKSGHSIALSSSDAGLPRPLRALPRAVHVAWFTLRSVERYETIRFGTVMRLACGLAIALGLTFAAWGAASRQQDGAGSGKSSGQAPAPTVPAQAPAKTVPDAPANPQPPSAEEKAPESAAKKNTEADSKNTGSTNGTAKRRKRAATASVAAPDGAPRKIVVREGGASEPTAQIIPGMTPAEAARQRQNTEQWLGSADRELKQLEGRKLDVQGQETVGQIRNYIAGARSALEEGDVRRASTLAEKAHLLADDLVKQ